jgi:hypothetical protein
VVGAVGQHDAPTFAPSRAVSRVEPSRARSSRVDDCSITSVALSINDTKIDLPNDDAWESLALLSCCQS